MEKKIKYCACGCCQEILIEKNKFIFGHYKFGYSDPIERARRNKIISEAKKGHTVSEETRKKISETFKKNGGHPFKGTTLSDEYKAKISKANKGKKRTDEMRLNISIAHKGITAKENHPMWGKTHSEESKKKMSEAHTGLKHSKETCIKIAIGHSGNKTHLWKGGISFEPYTPEFNKLLKKQIKERDNCQCQHPDCLKKNVKLHVHHINYIKKDQRPENLITLCGSHHCKTTTGNREFWTFFYQTIIDFKNMRSRLGIQ